MKFGNRRRVTRWIVRSLLIGCGLLVQPFDLEAASFDEQVRAIHAVAAEGQGHASAIAAVKELSRGNSSTLLPILNAFDNANPLASNWLRGAFEAVAARELERSKSLPASELESFIKQTNRHPEARRLAYEWLVKVDSSATERLIPGMLRDGSPEFRRDAVQRSLDRALKAHEEKMSSEAIAHFREALSGAVDDDQVKAIVKPLRELGEKVDLQKHFGFLTQWHLIGPFDNTDKKGFDIAYPPESNVDLDAKVPGKMGDVAWERHEVEDEYGVLNIAKKTAPHKGAVTYGYTTFTTDTPRNIEVRLGTPNAWKLWVNGELVFARDEYHRGTQLDQYRVKAKLNLGSNTLLIKVCQNEQTEEWAQDWKVQLRICDSTGAAILPTEVGQKTSRVDR
jgi:hypothetical protein